MQKLDSDADINIQYGLEHSETPWHRILIQHNPGKEDGRYAREQLEDYFIDKAEDTGLLNDESGHLIPEIAVKASRFAWADYDTAMRGTPLKKLWDRFIEVSLAFKHQHLDSNQYDNTILSTKSDYQYKPLQKASELEVVRKGTHHQIARGDTLTKIARKYNVSLESLVEANPKEKSPWLKNINLIMPGGWVRIPEPMPSEEYTEAQLGLVGVRHPETAEEAWAKTFLKERKAYDFATETPSQYWNTLASKDSEGYENRLYALGEVGGKWSNSGITLGVGVDLGQRDKKDTEEILLNYDRNRGPFVFDKLEKLDKKLEEIERNPYSQALIQAYKSQTGMTEEAASEAAKLDLMNTEPLFTITGEEAKELETKNTDLFDTKSGILNKSDIDFISNAFITNTANKLEKGWDKEKKSRGVGPLWKDLPEGYRKAFVSLGYNMGEDKVINKFRIFQQALKGSWQDVADHFKDPNEWFGLSESLKARRRREGDMVQEIINQKKINEEGDN